MENNNEKPDEFAKSSFYEEYLKMQIMQQEMLRAREYERLVREEENRKRQIEFAEKVKKYNAKCAQVHTTALKKWAGSGIVLALSIFSSIALVFSLVSVVFSLSDGIVRIIAPLVNLLLPGLVCAGFWCLYAMGKSKKSAVNAGGANILRGVLITNMVLSILLLSLIAVLVILWCIVLTISRIEIRIPVDGVSDTTNNAIPVELFVLIAVVCILFVIEIIYYTLALRFSKAVVKSLTKGIVVPAKTVGIAVMFFIDGGFLVVGSLSSAAILSAVCGFLESIGGVSGVIEAVGLLSWGWLNIVSELISALTFIFGGILAIKFGGLDAKTQAKINLLEKPVM